VIRSPSPKVVALVAALAATAAVIIVVLAGGESESEPGPSQAGGASAASVPENLPRAFADNAQQAGELEEGGREALEAKLADLEGHPVVVNQWGSWCPPCRAEFPFFAESAEAHLDEVAFLGVDVQDERGAAEDFLTDFPTPYPHVFDEDTEAVASLDWSQVSPTTWFIDERGEIAHQRPGAYASREELEADIDRFLLRG